MRMYSGSQLLCLSVAAVTALPLSSAITALQNPATAFISALVQPIAVGHITAVALIALILPISVGANYREFKFTNHDLCTSAENGRSLKLGKSAAIISFDSTDDSYSHKCNIKLQADKDFGLMAYVEEMNLLEPGGIRKTTCKEYIQFGRDDFLPFITLKKSERLCGNKTGYFYEEPDGKLLIWLQFSSKKLSDDRPKRLSIVITPYIKSNNAVGSTDYRVCQSGHQAIRSVYFCDDRVNCALDRGVAGDERPKICRHVPGRSDGNENTDQPPMWSPPLNLVSITLVLVSGVVLLVIVLLLLSRLRRFGLCCYKNRRGSCELPEGGLVAHNRADGPFNGDASTVTAMVTRDRRGGPYGTSAVTTTLDNLMLNNYPMLQYLGAGERDALSATGGGARPRMGRGTTPIDSEPPPAYHELFPAGYKYEADKVVTVTTVLEETSLTQQAPVQTGANNTRKPEDQDEQSQAPSEIERRDDGRGARATEGEGVSSGVTVGEGRRDD